MQLITSLYKIDIKPYSIKIKKLCAIQWLSLPRITRVS